jgi:hypothetical protein
MMHTVIELSLQAAEHFLWSVYLRLYLLSVSLSARVLL